MQSVKFDVHLSSEYNDLIFKVRKSKKICSFKNSIAL